ncbi:MAG: hypothetical protein U5J82_06045 [Desulfobacterales bacterium]|nr:hypothetical protein [Desulfobacterales bacterium]
MRSATWLIRSIHQRQKTIYKVMESILKFQGDFFEKGIAYLKPMVLRDVAQDIAMHESTISRVTTNKYAFTPQGIFELKYFLIKFDQPRSAVKPLHPPASRTKSGRSIESEKRQKSPTVRQPNGRDFKGAPISTSRAEPSPNYREMMGVLSSSKRKRYY